MRAFIAFSIPEEIKLFLEQTQKKLKNCHLDAKWVPPQNLHLTVKFFADESEEKILQITETLEKISSRFKFISTRLTEFGFFPHPKNPRVFFVKTDFEKEIEKIANKIEKEISCLGFSREKKFKSHITLARFKTRKNIDILLERIKTIKLNQPFTINRIGLYKSTLTNSGPIYKELFVTICRH